MGILNSIVVGKARNKAGSAVFYTRMGVPCFREKAVTSKNRSFSTTQLAQQKLYKFVKQNLDAFGIMPVVNQLFDMKSAAGKGQTTYNLFYKAFLPHIQAQREQISALADDELVSADLFFLQPEGYNDRLIEGVLGSSGGELSSDDSGNVELNISALAVQGLLEKANAKLSANDTPFTIENIFIGSITQTTANGNTIAIVNPTKATADSAGATIEHQVRATAPNGTFAYATIVVGYPGTGSGVDMTKKHYSADSLYLKVDYSTGPDIS